MMTKLIRWIPILLILAMVLAAIPVAASAPAVLSVQETAICNTSGEISILLRSDTPIQGGSFNLIYDNTVLEFLGYGTGSDLHFEVNAQYAPNKIRISFAGIGTRTNDVLISIVFLVRAESSCTTELIPEMPRFYDAAGNSVEATLQSAVCNIEVRKPLQSVSILPEHMNLCVGESASLQPVLTPSDAYVAQEEWQVNDPTILSVDNSGRITALRMGTTAVWYRAEGMDGATYWGVCNVSVFSKPNLFFESSHLAPGEEITLRVRLNTAENLLSAGSMNLLYDPAVLQLISAERGDLLQSAMVTINETYRQDAVRLNFVAGRHTLSGSGEICLLTFRALQAGDATVTAENVLLYNADEVELNAHVGEGSVEVKPALLSLQATQANAWEEFAVTLSYDSVMPIAGGGIVIAYDAQKLIPLGVDSLISSSMTVNLNYGKGLIKLSFAGTEPVSDTALASLRFITRSNEQSATQCLFSIVKEQLSLYDAVAARVQPDTESATVEILPNPNNPESGDILPDGVVNTRDASVLLQYLNGNTPYVIEELADLTGDGEVNKEDMEFLMKYLAEWDVTLPQ